LRAHSAPSGSTSSRDGRAQPLGAARRPLGLFAYGVLNRVLIVTGCITSSTTSPGSCSRLPRVTGDLKRFFAGDPSAGAFMSGFFP